MFVKIFIPLKKRFSSSKIKTFLREMNGADPFDGDFRVDLLAENTLDPQHKIGSDDIILPSMLIQKEPQNGFNLPDFNYPGENHFAVLNDTYHIDEKTGKSFWVAYPMPERIPDLMEQWLSLFNSVSPGNQVEAVKVYAKIHTSFVSVHPFLTATSV